MTAEPQSAEDWAAYQRPSLRVTNIQHPKVVAREGGELRYFTGKPCSNGHVAQRWTKTGQCVECAKSWYRTARGQDWSSKYNRGEPRKAKQRALAQTPEQKEKREQRQWDPERRMKATARRYGISLSHMRPIPLDGVCECCGGLGDWKRLVCEHEHKTKRFRGWVCRACNISIGLARDDVRRAHKVVEYIFRTTDLRRAV